MSRSLRIMHISTRLILGGSQENTILSCAGQAANGHTVSLLYGPIHGPEGSMLDTVTAHGGIEPMEVPHLVREVSPLRDVRCLAELRGIIRAWKPDVVHTHSSKAGILGRCAAWTERVPAVIHTIHGLAFHPFQSRLRNRLYIAAERFAARRCHRILVVADAMRRQALAEGIGHADQYEKVLSGIDTSAWDAELESPADVRAALGLDPRHRVVGTVARLAELKGHEDLLEGMAGAMRSDPDLALLWVGDGRLQHQLMDRARGLGIASQVHLAGLVPPGEIPRLHRAMDVLAHPSYREGLPRAVVQAMLSGLPVVTYDVDGAGEVCRDGETGRLVRVGDKDVLAETICEVLARPDAAAAMAREAQEMCRRDFDAARMVEHLETVYAGVLAD